jgi:NAD+ kinase
MRVGLLLKRDKPEARTLAGELTPFLRGLGHDVIALVEASEPQTTTQRTALSKVDGLTIIEESEVKGALDLLVVLGGDGTILRGATLVADEGVPILGLNLGTLGFLSTAPPTKAKETLERALARQLPLEERLRLRVELSLKSGETIVRYAANDAVVSQGALARLIELDVHVDDKRLTRYRADGLIVATPTGSTAYSLAAGGPIVAPDVQAVVLTPICPHTLTNRPIVLPSSKTIRMELAASVDHVQLTIDGQWGSRIQHGDVVRLSQADKPLYLYRGDGGQFGVLREKLRWGE